MISVDPRRLLSVLGLLPALLFEKQPKVVFCRTPVGDNVICWLLSQLSVIRFRAGGLLFVLWFKTSPNGPPIDVSQETGIQFTCCDLSLKTFVLVVLPTPNPILRGEKLTLSLIGDEFDDMKSVEAIGMEIESCVLSDCGQSSMNWRREFWDFSPPLLVLCNGLSKESEQTSPNSESGFCFRSIDDGGSMVWPVAFSTFADKVFPLFKKLLLSCEYAAGLSVIAGCILLLGC